MLKIIFLAYFETIGWKGQRELAITVAFPTCFQIDFPELYQWTAPPRRIVRKSFSIHRHQHWLLTFKNKIPYLFNKFKSIYLSLNNKQLPEFVTRCRFPQMRATLCKKNKKKIKLVQIKLVFQRITFIYSTNAVIWLIKAEPQEKHSWLLCKLYLKPFV